VCSSDLHTRARDTRGSIRIHFVAIYRMSPIFLMTLHGTLGDPAIPVCGFSSCPRGGRHEACHGPGSPCRRERSAPISGESKVAPGGPAIPAWRWVSCPRGGRHEACCRSGSRTTGSLTSKIKPTARRSRPMDRSRAPGGEATGLAVGRDPRVVSLPGASVY
jgi:hypothetical protein